MRDYKAIALELIEVSPVEVRLAQVTLALIRAYNDGVKVGTEPRCAFCGKLKSEVVRMVKSQANVAICNQCHMQMLPMLAEQTEEPKRATTLQGPPGRTTMHDDIESVKREIRESNPTQDDGGMPTKVDTYVTKHNAVFPEKDPR